MINQHDGEQSRHISIQRCQKPESRPLHKCEIHKPEAATLRHSFWDHYVWNWANELKTPDPDGGMSISESHNNTAN